MENEVPLGKTESSEVNSIENGFHMHLRDDGVVELNLKDKHSVSSQNLIDMQIIFEGLAVGDKSYPVIAITGKSMGMTEDARHIDIFAEVDYNISRLAIVITSFFPKLLASWYFRYVTQPEYEDQIYDNLKDANVWVIKK